MALRWKQELEVRSEELNDEGRVVVAEGWAFRCHCPELEARATPQRPLLGKCFESSGWATKKAAQERARQHAAEHESGEPMPELAAFIGDRGSRIVQAEVKARGE